MSRKGSVERELKFPCLDLESLRQRLRELEAERVGAAGLEDNWVFDRDGELQKEGRLLRLRSDRSGCRLTYKGPARFDGGVKERAEHETDLEDEAALRQILEALGYSVVRRYQKMREEWRLGGVMVALDRTPIGDYAEFEGEGAETVAKRCGLEAGDAEKRNYLQLYDDYLREHPDAPPDMVFP